MRNRTQNHRAVQAQRTSKPLNAAAISVTSLLMCAIFHILKPAGRLLRRCAFLLIGLAAIMLLENPIAANSAEIYKTEDWTSWAQLYNVGSDTEKISNNGDFYVDGVLASNIKCGAGMLKDGNIIGRWDNFAQYGAGHAFGGSVNVDPTTNNPASNLNALVVGERNNGMWGTLDANGDGNWGYLDFWDDGMIDVHFDDYELILDQQGILVDGVRGDFSALPRYLGSVDGMENNGKIPSVELDSSYAIPEPLTLSFLSLGAIALLRRTSRRKRI